MPTGHFNFKKGWRASRGQFDDPTYVGFSLMFVFDNIASPILSDENTSEENCQKYFRNRGLDSRVDMLKSFKKQLQSINKNSPHFWQSIEGIDKVDRFDFRSDSDDKMIFINTLESIDLRTNALIDLYKHSVFDYEHYRELAPQNMRYFDMMVYVTEIRNFNAIIESERTRNSSNDVLPKFNNETLKVINENSSNLLYYLKKCEFVVDESGSPELSTIDNKGGEMLTNRIAIKYKRIEKVSNYALLDVVIDPNITRKDTANINSDEKNGIKSGLTSQLLDEGKRRLEARKRSTASFLNTIAEGDSIRDRLNNLGQRAVLNAANNFADLAEGEINQIVLGNVYTNRSRLVNALQQASLGNLFDNI